ncbi:hypothetical protein Poli38472_004769 [Pythium oligandrum]|uniref:Uncharacterized protein n=1 Tax=Pythium oligandrum TaxID=41045 RepID=A0A8K1FDR6_PYTOL|nr:hypothetical protein Poli38472_004769 [Pythium oligandrum]|eukprot:TMW59700.1 hypothetical protein Poli38472_004769 [Pythium oligandrum]
MKDGPSTQSTLVLKSSLRRAWSAQVLPHRPAEPPSQPERPVPNADQGTNDVKLELAPPLYRFVWCGVALVCFLNAVFVTTITAVYYFSLTIREGYLLEWIGLLPLNEITIVLGLYAFTALYFWEIFFRLLYHSLRRRRLTFVPYETLSERIARHQKPSRWIPRVWHRLRLWWLSLHAPGGTFEVTERGFEVFYLGREIMEIVTQTYQAYKCSTLISYVWINTLSVGTLVVNCWLSPIIHVSTDGNLALQRFLYLCSDVVLDCVSTVFVPMFIFISVIFVVLFDGGQTGGDTEYAFDVPYGDVFIMDIIHGVQQTLTVTWLDVFTKMLPFLSMATCLNHLMKLVHRQHCQDLKTNQVAAIAVVKRTSHDSSTNSNRLTLQAPHVRSKWVSFCCSVRRYPTVRSILSVRWIYFFFFIWGVLILAVHLHAQYTSGNAPAWVKHGCKSASRPWLVRRFSCKILEINCYHRGLTGSAGEIDAVLQQFNPSGLSSLIISHCPHLHIPARIQSFPVLSALEIANATLLEWGNDVVVSHSTMPNLQMVALVRVNMTELPEAILSADLPYRFRDMTICASNLTMLPPDLSVKWHRLFNLFLERTHVDNILPALRNSQMMRLSLMGNRIHDIPDDLFEQSRFNMLSIAKNPITKWPKTIGRLDDLTMLLMDYTEISELPLWLLEEGQRRVGTGIIITVSAGGSPYCRIKQLASPSTFKLIDESLPGLKVVCREKREEEFEAYPLSFSLTNRPL